MLRGGFRLRPRRAYIKGKEDKIYASYSYGILWDYGKLDLGLTIVPQQWEFLGSSEKKTVHILSPEFLGMSTRDVWDSTVSKSHNN